MSDFDQELKLGFLEEAAQGLAEVEQCFLDLERDPNQIETINKIFRLAHNLKGSSRAVGFDDMGHFTHAFESFILRIKNGELEVTSQVVNLLLKANDHLKEMVETYQRDLSAKVDSTDLIQLLQNFHPELSGSDLAVGSEDNEKPDSEASLAEDQVSMAEKLSDAKQIGSVLQLNHNTDEVSIGHAKSTKPTSSPSLSDQSIRVSLHKVENLINFVGELVILQSVLKEQLNHLNRPEVNRTFNQLNKVSKEIQDLAMGLRMVPIRPTFQKMVRIVRDTAQALGKEIEIILQGEETELDKTVLERITDPLVHLVRNAVDHGIESADKRIQVGKSTKGRVRLAAYHKSGRLIIEIEDDGGGLNPDKLRQKAIEKGIIHANAQLSLQEIHQLIFAPGFSTKDQVTDISGRGVGMDVVKTNIAEMGGEILIHSEVNKGTRFTISLPLTLAIIEAMIAQVGDHRFVLPLGHVWETLKVDPRMITQTTELGDMLLLRGEPILIYRLGDFFGLEPSGAHKTEEMIAIVNRSTSRAFALIVEDIIGQGQVVIKQLTPELQGLQGISGVTILGDGKPAFIVEPTEIIKRKLVKKKPLIMEVS